MTIREMIGRMWRSLWELAGLSDRAPAGEKGYSMLTAAAKKKAAEMAKAAKKKKSEVKTE